MIERLIRRLRKNQHGAAAVEFALAAPVLLVGMMGVFDLGYNMYTASLLQGAIQKAARDSTIEGADDATIDARVAKVVHDIAPQADTPTFNRTSYTNFSGVGRPEDYDDLNANSTCDNGEQYEDANGNGTWDANRGKAGMGGARDAVLYEVTVTYTRLFPVAKFIGQSGDFTLKTLTVLRNQPYSLSGSEIALENCA